jgi:hypothetical protein
MPTYYLQEGVPESTGPARMPQAGGIKLSKVFLDDKLHDKCVLIQKIEADSWKEARLQIPG